ncbi:MAG: RnfABCDGE type electron transport complex subunit G [Deltaproteobacteria bacterium]|nr:RnfABCDGE type electron transport complex subunit G [Deltaproteobacteria bacterium]MBN2670909.1 RnfABCDGE type electron transport complex subunit G [Deltaproteobacteria bacterium]
MPESVKMILVLTLISGAAGLGLSAMNDLTKPLAEENDRLFTLSSINTVMPEAQTPDACESYEPAFDNSPDQDAVCVGNTIVYRGRKGDEITGIAVKAIGDEAYSGTITVLVGLRMNDGVLTGLKVLKHAETPGLGSLMTKCEFQQQMVGKGVTDINWTVVKDGGDISQLSGATISSRSMLSAIHKAQAIWKDHKDEIQNDEALAQGEVCDGQ